MANYKIPAKYVRSDRDFVYLNCMIDTNNKVILEKKFPKSSLEGMSLVLDKSIIINVKEKPRTIIYSFEEDKTSLVDDYFREEQIPLEDNSIFEKH